VGRREAEEKWGEGVPLEDAFKEGHNNWGIGVRHIERDQGGGTEARTKPGRKDWGVEKQNSSIGIRPPDSVESFLSVSAEDCAAAFEAEMAQAGKDFGSSFVRDAKVVSGDGVAFNGLSNDLVVNKFGRDAN
jgi:hypothetical protein